MWTRCCMTTSSRSPSGTRSGPARATSESWRTSRKPTRRFPTLEFIARTPLIPGVNADEEHIRAVLAFIRPHKNVIDYELLPYHRFGLGKYMHLGKVYELDDYQTPSDEVVKHLQAIIDEGFGRTGK